MRVETSPERAFTMVHHETYREPSVNITNAIAQNGTLEEESTSRISLDPLPLDEGRTKERGRTGFLSKAARDPLDKPTSPKRRKAMPSSDMSIGKAVVDFDGLSRPSESFYFWALFDPSCGNIF